MHEEAESTMLFDIMVDSVDFGITDDAKGVGAGRRRLGERAKP